jgi:hypothetical protein
MSRGVPIRTPESKCVCARRAISLLFSMSVFRLVNPFTFTPHGNPKWSSKARFLEDPGP